MSLVFQKPNSEKLTAVTFLIIRVGMSFAFFWAGSGKIGDPAGFGKMLQNVTGIDPSIATSMAMLIGIFEIVSAVFILAGFLTRPAAAFQITVLVGAMAMFGLDFTAGPAIWKDPTMLGVAAGLFIYGSGKLGVDHIISKKIHKKQEIAE